MKQIKNASILLIYFALFQFWSGNTTLLASNSDAIIVYYFHRTFRCPSCTTLERVTRESVEFAFEKELKTGKIKMISIDIDKKENEHFANDYNLEFQSVILSDVRGGKEKRWKKLDKVWKLLHEEWDLREYIQKEIRMYTSL